MVKCIWIMYFKCVAKLFLMSKIMFCILIGNEWFVLHFQFWYLIGPDRNKSQKCIIAGPAGTKLRRGGQKVIVPLAPPPSQFLTKLVVQSVLLNNLVFAICPILKFLYLSPTLNSLLKYTYLRYPFQDLFLKWTL